MTAVSGETLRQRVSDWLRSLQTESNGTFRVPPAPSPRLLKGAKEWRPSSGHLVTVRNDKDYQDLSDNWGLAPYYYDGPGAYELQHVHGMCGCRYVTLRRVAVLVDMNVDTLNAEDCQEPVWASDIREAARWQVPDRVYREIEHGSVTERQ